MEPRVKQPFLALCCGLVLAGVAQASSLRRLDAGWRMVADSGWPGTATAISRPGFDASGWYVATVPGTVLATLVSQGVYPDPLFGDNIAAIPDLAGENRRYWYRTEFELGPEDQGRRVWLTLHGINYRADVWVNGQLVGSLAGAFKRGVFDITGQAAAPGGNALAVLIHPNDSPGTVHYRTLSQGTSNGGAITRDGPTFICTIGWDWIPTIPDRCMGIWREVTVQTTGPVVLRDPFVTTDLPLPDTTLADVAVSVDVENATAEPQSGSLCGRIGEVEFQQVVALGPAERRRVTLSPECCPQLRLANPRLWWPNGYGTPELYTLDLQFIAEDGVVSDTTTTRFGVREFSYDFAPELVVSVNGYRVFCRGGNWGFAEALNRNSLERYRNLIRLHRDANLNMIRNWIGMTDCPEFYDLCDENGIMVWDEFWLANPYDGREPTDPQLFLDNAADKIRRNRNHPSIALWCARNEGLPPPLLDEGLRQLVRDLDGTRRYQRSSSSDGVHGGGPWMYQPPESYLWGWGWAHGFTTEIGLPCVPSADTMRQMMPAADLWPISEMWAWHDYAAGNGRPSDYTDAVNMRYGTATGLDDFCRKAQLLNLESHRAIFESWNQRMWAPDEGASGVLLWATNPCWPSTVWQLYDYYLEPTGAYFGVKSACEPVHVQMSLVDGMVSVINTTLQDLPGLVVTARVFHLDGSEEGAASMGRADVAAPANLVTPCFQLVLPSTLVDVYFVKLVARDSGGQLVSENFYWRSGSDPDFTSLSQLPAVEFGVQTEVTVVPSAAGDVGRVSVVLTNPTANVVIAARLKLTAQRSGLRVLPVFWSDNYVSFLPGETRTVSAEFDPARLAGDLPVLGLEGWNVTPLGRGLLWPDPPAAVVMDENASPRPFSLTLNATVADNRVLTWSIATQASHGTATAAGTGASTAIGYTPRADWSGHDSFVVQVSDGRGDSATVAVQVTVNRAHNALPTIAGPALQTVVMDEDSSPTAFHLDLQATDADNDTLTWSILHRAAKGSATARGYGDRASIGYTPLGNYAGRDCFVVQVADGHGGADSTVVNVTVNPVNDPPTGAAGCTVTVRQGGTYTYAASDFGFTDPYDNPANALLAVKVTTLPLAGILADNGVRVTAGQFVALGDIADNRLTFTPTATASGAPYASFMFQVQDDGGTANGGLDLDPTPKKMTINVAPVTVAAERALWDLTGLYGATLATTRGDALLKLDLVHGTRGTLTGTSTLQVPTGKTMVPVPMVVRGAARGGGGALAVTLEMRGANAANQVNASLSFRLTLDAAARQLAGPVTGRIRVGDAITPLDDSVALDIRGGMDGSWTLQFGFHETGRTVTGTAELMLSNDVKHSFVVRGRTGANHTVALTLAGDPANPASKAISIRTTLTPLEGGGARLESFSGKGYGQVIRW